MNLLATRSGMVALVAAIGSAMKARVSRDPLTALPRASAEALHPRIGTLVAAWPEYVRLTAVSG